MKALFIVYHGFNDANGISKKISYQINALKEHGIDTQLCYLKESGGYKKRMIDETVLYNYGNGLKGKVLKRIEFNSIADYAIQNHIQIVYIRSDHNASPFTISMIKKMKSANIHIVMEIPTFPYDKEKPSAGRRLQRFIDKIYRIKQAKQLDKIITFSEDSSIFGIPTIRISNGIDFSKIKLKQNINDTTQALHLIGVAEIHYWHGFDRLIRGLVNYYQGTPEYKVYFHIIGDLFGEREKSEILPLIEKNDLTEYVIMHGAKHGEDLDQLFEMADMAIGSLARHRSGITNIKTLKNREYAARGLSFIYSEIDADFENKPYILKVPADESAINIPDVINFHRQQSLAPLEIRNSIQSLSWKEQMGKVVKELESYPDL